MDFQKKVTYLYDYEENGKSIGFAKWDVRNGMLRLLVNIRYQNREKDGTHSVFFYGEEGQRILIGEMKILCGIGELRYMGRADSIQNAGCTYEQITGVQVENGDNILFYGDFVDKKPEKNGYEILYDEKKAVTLFSDEDIYDCVEIEPEDIKRFANTNWGLLNNSFLNHGYYAYRHLIFGKQAKSDGYEYIIGVPGVFTRRDKNMAGMFGFMHFKFSTRSDIRLSQFGYWYKVLEA